MLGMTVAIRVTAWINRHMYRRGVDESADSERQLMGGTDDAGKGRRHRVGDVDPRVVSLRGIPTSERGSARYLTPPSWAEFFGSCPTAFQSTESSECHRVWIFSSSHDFREGQRNCHADFLNKTASFGDFARGSCGEHILDRVRSARRAPLIPNIRCVAANGCVGRPDTPFTPGRRPRVEHVRPQETQDMVGGEARQHERSTLAAANMRRTQLC